MKARQSSAFAGFVLRAICIVACVAALEGAGSIAAHADQFPALCGDATGDGRIEASDALFALHVAVGTQTGSLLRCDCNQSGSVTASDAMAILKAAVGIPVELRCPLPDTASSTTTTTTTTTTTSSTLTTTTSMPEHCGNGILDPGEECEEGFCRGGCNPFTGLCVDFLCQDDCSCPAPLCGDYMIDPAEDCDPPGSPCDGGTCGERCHCD